MSENKNPNIRLTWKDPRTEEVTKQAFSLPLTIGRDSSNLLKVPSPSISRQHARIEFMDDKISFKDLGSSNGSAINETDTTEGFLKNGDILRLGVIEFNVEVVEGRGGGERPSMDKLYGALYEGESQPTISLTSLDDKKGLFAEVDVSSETNKKAISDMFAKMDKANEDQDEKEAAPKLSGDELKAFISGRIQTDLKDDISPDVEVLGNKHRDKSKPDEKDDTPKGIRGFFKRLFGG